MRTSPKSRGRAGAAVVVTDNRRHFLAALRYGMRVETPGEFLASLKTPARLTAEDSEFRQPPRMGRSV